MGDRVGEGFQLLVGRLQLGVEALQPRFGLLALGDVAGGGVDELFLQHGRGFPQKPPVRPVFAPITVFERRHDRPGVDFLGLSLGGGAVVEMNEIEVGRRQQLFAAEPENLLPDRVQALEVAVEASNANEIERQSEKAVQLLFGAPALVDSSEFLFHLAAGGIAAVDPEGVIANHPAENEYVGGGEESQPELRRVQPCLLAHQPKPAKRPGHDDNQGQQTTRQHPSHRVAGQNGHQAALGTRAKNAGGKYDETDGCKQGDDGAEGSDAVERFHPVGVANEGYDGDETRGERQPRRRREAAARLHIQSQERQPQQDKVQCRDKGHAPGKERSSRQTWVVEQ